MILNPRFRASATRPCRAIATAALFALGFAALPAAALDFQVDFRESTYQVDGDDAFADPLAQHERERLIQSNVTDGSRPSRPPCMAAA